MTWLHLKVSTDKSTTLVLEEPSNCIAIPMFAYTQELVLRVHVQYNSGIADPVAPKGSKGCGRKLSLVLAINGSG